MKLIVVESPAKARKIKTFLGSDYQVEASVGHIREIPPKGLNIDVKNGFEPTYEIIHGKGDVVKNIRDLAKKAEVIYLAADGDREGEFIALSVRAILDKASQSKCRRITYNEITKKAILDALGKARDIDMNIVASQKARQVLDRLIGYKVSPVLWYSVARGTSAGRVQSIALKFVCDRQREIDNFKPEKYWTIDALLAGSKGKFWARVIVPKNKDNRFTKEAVAKKTFDGIKTSSFTLSDVKKSSRQVKPSPPFDTNSLQVSCSSIFKWNATRAMKVAQSLYENGKISYLRTDSFNISPESLEEARSFIKSSFGDKYLPKSANVYAKKGKVAAQEAHECIRPTHVEDDGLSMDGDEQKLYCLIRDRFLACQMEPMVIDVVTYTVKASCGDELVATGQAVTFDGFSKVWKHTKIDEQTLPSLTQGESLSLEDSKFVEKQTEPPDRYNDGSLVKKMEKEGVGRPSTWASIIGTLEKKKYLDHEKTALVPSALGIRINDFLSPAFKNFFMDVTFTANLEEELDKIENGELDFLTVVSKVYDKLVEEIKGAKKDSDGKPKNGTGIKCLVCKEGEIVERFAKTGSFFACDRYPDCKATFEKADDGSFKSKDSGTGVKCLACKKGEIVERSSSKGKFFSCSRYPDCKATFEKNENEFSLKEKKKPAKDTGRKCPKCGKSLVERTSRFGKFVGCSGYPGCKFIEKESKKDGLPE